MKEPWFERRGASRMFPIHWKGWLSVAGFIALVVIGKGADHVLRPGPPWLYGLAVIPLCLAAMGLVWLVHDRFKR